MTLVDVIEVGKLKTCNSANVLSPLHDLLLKLETSHDQLQQIEATLKVNCMPDRSLTLLGISYDDTKTVHSNLYWILEQLYKLATKTTPQLPKGKPRFCHQCGVNRSTVKTYPHVPYLCAGCWDLELKKAQEEMK